MTGEIIFEDISSRLVSLDLDGTLRSVRQALDAGHPAHIILKEGLSRGMDAVGELYEKKEYFIADLVTSAYIMNEALNLLEEKMKGELDQMGESGTVVFGTVRGDLHDIGKNIAISLLRASGYKVHDLGIDVPVEAFLEKVREVKPDILCMSALLILTIPVMGEVIDTLKKNKLRDQVFIMIGGRCTSEAFAKEIGADAYCETALDGVTKAKEYMRVKKAQEISR